MAEGAESVDQLVVVAISGLDRAVAKGVLHRNNAARRKARLMKRLQTSGQVPAASTPATAPAKGSRSSAPAQQPARSTRSKATSKR